MSKVLMIYLGLFLLGALAALAMPPFGMWPLFIVATCGFLILAEKRQFVSYFQLFLNGWLFGFGYFLAVLQWISNAFYVDAQNDLGMMPFAVGGLSAFLAVFWGFGHLGAVVLQRRGVPLFIGFPVVLGLVEYLRGHVFTGFPWAVPGLLVDGMGGVAQAASVIGMNGLSFVVLLWATAPLVFWKRQRVYYPVAAVILLLLPAMWIWGNWRLAANPTEMVPNVTLRLVQPNIPQNDKWRSGNASKIWNTLLDLTRAAPKGGNAPTHVIWPESSVPFLLDESSEAQDALRDVLGGTKTLLAGAVRRQPGTKADDYFTSVQIYDPQAKLQASYDKWHLVPGGEFLPLAWLLEPLGLRRLVSMPESFSAGNGPQSIAVVGAGLVAPSICYEAIFPEAFSNISPRPDWFVNVTNDGWFGDSAGPYQHLAQLRLRAIEQGVPVARAANTGISAVIDPVGRFVFRSSINVEGAFDVGLPQAITLTLFARWGAMLQFIFPVLSLIVILFWRKVDNE